MGYKIKPKYPLFLRNINKGGSVDGYPVVTLEDDFNIQAKPNTFYNINNGKDDEINITFVDEEFYANVIVNEFIFNINSPTNISFDKEIKWNDNKEPDLTKEGIYTINIFNGVGRYTFINTNSSIPDNEIWYTSIDDNIVYAEIPLNKGENITNSIVSNIYENGKGIITFQNPIESLPSNTDGESLFLNWQTNNGERLSTIILPKSVKTIIGFALSFDKSNFQYIEVQETIESINIIGNFSEGSNHNIKYNGTKSQWNNVIIHNLDSLNRPITVHCTDGNITISQVEV